MTTATVAVAPAVAERIVWEGSTLKFFSRFDGPYVPQHIALGNHPLRKIIERHFEYMSRNLYFISALSRYVLGYKKEAEILKAEDVTARTILNAKESMEKRIKQAEVLIEQAGLVENVKYAKLENIEIPVTSPGSRMYAELLVATDRFYSLNTMLWLEGHIDNKTRFANESDARREVQNVVRGVAAQFSYILKKTRETDEAVAASVSQHDEVRLENEASEAVDAELSNKGMLGNIGKSKAPEAVAAAA